MKRTTPMMKKQLEVTSVDYAAMHRELETHIPIELQALVNATMKVNETIADAIASRSDLITQVKWGNGVQDNLRAEHAMQILGALETGVDLVAALTWARDYERDALARNQYAGQSTNAYSNAVDADRREVGRQVVEQYTRWLNQLARYRGAAEVL